MMRLVKQGNQEAAARLVEQFEPKIHVAIRRLLLCRRLRREFDAHDISQAVLAAFFVRKLAARCDLKHPDELARLLIRMAKNKVRDEVRKLRAGRRDHRRLEPGQAECVLNALMQRNANPSSIVAVRDLLREIFLRFDDDERALAEKRTEGVDWVAIANEHGDSAEALRKKLARAVERVRLQLDL
jgi:DNA-directed RNA polymerase specialized sigma24 family protein